ncbi:MAG: outer membrane beta-barrel protein [Elusimicrobiales bacterium]|nr:outer membrane beta-barrel protein [Elusimicrobiales bacterium]
MKKLIIPAIMFFAASNAAAMGNIRFGNLEINPFVSVEESYDSNIYLEMDAKNSSMINRTGVGVDLMHKLGSRIDLTGGYTLELLSYDESPSTNNAAHNLANLGVKVRLPKKMSLTVQDKYADTTDQATTQETDRAERIQNDAKVRFEAPIRGKFGFALEAAHTYHNYIKVESLDREELIGGADITYQLKPKTQAMLSYRYGEMDYNKDTSSAINDYPDSTYHNIDVGMVGRIAPKLTGTVKAGVQLREYDKAPAATVDKNITTGGYSAQLLWKAVPRTDIMLYARRANVETRYDNSRFYTTTLTDLSFSREVRKVKLTLGASYEFVEYAENTSATGIQREDRNIGARLAAAYNIQNWLKAGLSFNHKARLSNEANTATGVEFGYRDNIIAGSLKAMF